MGIKYFDDFEGTWIDGPKVYAATFTQSGTNDPVVNILDNTVGNINWVYDSSGIYNGYLDNGFINFHTISFSFGMENDAVRYGTLLKISNGQIILYTKDSDFNTQDDLLNNTFIEFKVYP